MSDQHIDDIQQIPRGSINFQTELAQKLNELVPEVITDGKIDVKKISELLGNDINDDSERFGLFWPGKKRAIRAAQEPTTATLRPARDESKDWDTTENIFIEGDNLETLKIIQKYYHNKIKMIYIDPPYNTGKDFVYPDNFKEGLANYLDFTNQVNESGKKVSTNSDTDGRYHSNWLNMMYPRLKLARNLLTEDGLIFISIGDHEIHNLKQLCTEIFGEDNFEGLIHWRRRHNQPNDPTKLIGLVAEHILVFARNSQKLKVAGVGKLPLTGKFSNPDSDPKGNWNSKPWKVGSGQNGSKYQITSPNGVVFDGEWMGDQNNFNRLMEEGRIYFPDGGNGTPRKKIYESERLKEGQSASNWFPNDVFGNNQQASKELEELFDGRKRVFDNPKPTLLLKNLMRLANLKDGDIVLDFFAGSGTTADALFQYNADNNVKANFINIQLPEPLDPNSKTEAAAYNLCKDLGLPKNIASICRERLSRSGAMVAQRSPAIPKDYGYKVFKLTDSNFTKWQSSSDTDQDSLQQHLLNIRESSNDAATEEELLTEVLLKQGISLTAKIKHEELSGLSVWNVGETTVLAYLNESIKPDLAQLRNIAASEPAKIIILEDAFQGDDELKTNLAQICKTNKIELWTV